MEMPIYRLWLIFSYKLITKMFTSSDGLKKQTPIKNEFLHNRNMIDNVSI